LVCLGMSFSAGIGTLAHASLPLDLTCVALWGFGFGLMNMVGRGAGWLALQGSIALVIAAAFPATPVFAAWRSLLVLAGGAVQLVVVLAIHWLAPVRFLAPAANASVTVGSILSQVRAMIEGRAPGLAHAFAMALAVSGGEVLYRVLEMPNGYWVPMTVLLILRPVARETAARALARLLGTLCGVGLLTLLMALLRPSIPVLVGPDRSHGVGLLRVPAGELCDLEYGDHDVRGAAVRVRWPAGAAGCAASGRGNAAGRGNRIKHSSAGHLGHATLAEE